MSYTFSSQYFVRDEPDLCLKMKLTNRLTRRRKKESPSSMRPKRSASTTGGTSGTAPYNTLNYSAPMALQPVIVPMVVFNVIPQPQSGIGIEMPQIAQPPPVIHHSAQQARPQKMAIPSYPPPPQLHPQLRFPRGPMIPTQGRLLPPKLINRPFVPLCTVGSSEVMSSKKDFTLPPQSCLSPRPIAPPKFISHSSVNAGGPNGAFVAPKRDYAIRCKMVQLQEVQPPHPRVPPSIIYHGPANAPATLFVHRPSHIPTQIRQHSAQQPELKPNTSDSSKKSDIKRSVNTSKKRTKKKGEIKIEWGHKAEAAVAMLDLAKCYKGKANNE